MVNPEGNHSIDCSATTEENLLLGEEAWRKEFSELEDLVAQTRTAYFENNPVARMGYKQIFGRIKSSLKHRGRTFESVDEFAWATLAILESSCNAYSNETMKPARSDARGRLIYIRPKGAVFSPRHIRLLIKRKGLNGEITPSEELGRAEEYEPSYLSSNVRQSVETAQTRLLWALTPNYVPPWKADMSMTE